MYLFIGIASVFSTSIMNKIGEIKCMAIGSLLCVPWIFSLSLAEWNKDYKGKGDPPFYISKSFIYFAVIIFSILTGLGTAI